MNTIELETRDTSIHHAMRNNTRQTFFGHEWLLMSDHWTITPQGFRGVLKFQQLEKAMDLKKAVDLGTHKYTTDCYHRALPDEPTFTLLARDPSFARRVRDWAHERTNDIRCGVRPQSDGAVVESAYRTAEEGEKWRKENDGKWRVRPPKLKLNVGELYKWFESRTGNIIMVRLVAIEDDEAVIHDGNRLNIVHQGVLS